MRSRQSGVMLLEAMIAILIFSFGVLGVVGMQAAAVTASRDAKYRTDAGLLANEILGQMWTGDRTGTVLQTNFQGDGEQADATNVVTDGPLFTPWMQRVVATLPGVLENPPLVAVTPGVVGPPQTSSTVSITVRWRSPNDISVHNYRVIVQII